ncbi:MAG: ScpA family protein [Candidatus Paceibacterota bacterium]
MQDNFKIKTEVFEGPLELLLSLIEKRKLLINDISLAQVTDDFIKYLESHPEMPINQSSQFIVIASTLLLIKSKSLLPTLTLTEEENKNVEDLELRLKIYQKYKEAGEKLSEIFGKSPLFERNFVPTNDTVIFAPSKNISIESLKEAGFRVLQKIPKVEKLPQAIVRKVVSLEETMQKLTSRIKSSLQMSFKDFAGVGKAEKVNVIVSFIAMLELVKQGMIAVTQSDAYEDIKMETKDISTPNYL